VLIDRRGAGETAGYPTICKGRYEVGGKTFYAIEEPTSLNTMELLPELMALGVVAVKIEGRQRSPAYVRDVTRVWRAAIDACARDAAGFRPAPDWSAALARVSEGAQTTFGALHRPWQ
jgi:putative protease